MGSVFKKIFENFSDRHNGVPDGILGAAVKGGDLREFVRAPAIGSLLNALLEEVMQGGLPNSRELLLKRAGELAQDCAQPVLRRHD